jgi:glutaredoxin
MMMPGQTAPALPEVYWTPHCSSCMAVKQFLERRGVAYRSVNVAADPEAMIRLAELGVRSVPVVILGDRFVFAQYLDDVAAFLSLDANGAATHDPGALGARLAALLEIAHDVTTRLPEAIFRENLPGRDRSYFVVAHHVFQIAHAARLGIPAGALHDADSLAEPTTDLATRADLLAFAGQVLAEVGAWRSELARASGAEPVLTDYGQRPLSEVLHRVVSHAAQHTRQLSVLAHELDVPLTRDVGPDLLAGLTLAEETFDQPAASVRS